MDPEITLNQADQAISDGDYDTARDRLIAYTQWRNRHGFEPHMRHAAKRGDDFAADCQRRLFDALL